MIRNHHKIQNSQHFHFLFYLNEEHSAIRAVECWIFSSSRDSVKVKK